MNRIILLILLHFICLAEDLADYENNIFSFIHVSDTHLSKISTNVRNQLFDTFTATIIPLLSPELVVHSGDITDGWIEGKKTGEIKEEWELYKSILSTNNMFNDTFWLDVRGNHDSANQDRSSHHYFYNYTTCGHLGRVYNKVYEKSFGTYCFVGVDSTLSPSPGVLLTYFGYVDRQSQHSLRAILDSNNQFCNHTILFTHYPSLYLNTPALQSIYYQTPPSFVLSGHVHSTQGSKANTKLNANTIELVIRDFKIRNIFRLMVIDNDYLNYIDCSVNETLASPIILVTNPPNSQLLSNKQSLKMQAFSRFIHIMAYDIPHNNSIQTDGFSVFIDHQRINSTLHSSSETPHLFLLPWNASLYRTGLHLITVKYSSVEYSHTFILSPYSPRELSQVNSTLSYSTILNALSPGFNFGGYLISSSLSPILITLSFSIPLIIVTFLVVARRIVTKFIPPDTPSGTQQRLWIADYLFHHPTFKGYPTFFKRWLLLTSDRPVYLFLVTSLLWQLFGIWSIGTFPKEFGIQFLWGVFFPTAGQYSLWLDTFFWHTLSLLVFWIPVLFYYALTMVPEGVLGSASPRERAVDGVAQCLWAAYFVGLMVVVKLYFVWDSFHPGTLLASPVWCWFGVIQCGFLLRELAYRVAFLRMSVKPSSPSETVLVSSFVS